MSLSTAKFDAARAAEYAEQSRLALAGDDACHELAACLLSAELGERGDRQILILGGTAQEILVAGKLRPGWRFTAIDPSPPMLAGARASVEAAGLAPAVTWHGGYIEALPEAVRFDAATAIGLLHHLSGREAKISLLNSVAAKLPPKAPLILACNRGDRSRKLEARGAEIGGGDLLDFRAVRRAFDGVKRGYLVSPCPCESRACQKPAGQNVRLKKSEIQLRALKVNSPNLPSEMSGDRHHSSSIGKRHP